MSAPDGMIDITGIDLRKLVRAVYNNSVPQGLGWMHAKNGELTDEEVDTVLSGEERFTRKPDNLVFHMDYVNGRSCKFVVWKDGDTLFTRDRWYDHSTEALNEMLGGLK